ncbi:NAD(P)-dependent alcohol dehydrogenase [Priestia megaterium]|nr:NAD(P)-dependent alcohol dehydrogenase [Priestia megaterium]
MKTIVYTKYGPPSVLQLKEVEKPIPKDNEILVKVIATTVTVADIRARSFNVPRPVWLFARIALGIKKPKKEILGMELAGEVESIGKDVKRFKVGDHVFAATLKDFGAYAEYKCLPEDGPISIMPKDLSFEKAAAIPIGGRTALFHLRKANIQIGQKVLVYGASGSVGSYAVQIAKHFGANVTAVCSTKNLELVKFLGANRAIDYTTMDFSAIGDKFDVIFEAVGKSSFSACMKSLKKNGTYINIANPLPSFRMLWTKLTSRKKLIFGQNSPETPEALNYLKELIETGVLKVLIDRCYTFEDIIEAHKYVEKGHKKGNVIINIGDINNA